MAHYRMQSFVSARKLLLVIAAITALATTACGSNGASPTLSPASEQTATPQPSSVVDDETNAIPVATPGLSAEPGLDIEVFEELNPLPELRAVDRSIDFGFDEREALPRDLINPIYSPKFVTPAEVAGQILDEELVMGLNIGGDARAYPVGIMRFREIVNDEVGGIPLLVTW